MVEELTPNARLSFIRNIRRPYLSNTNMEIAVSDFALPRLDGIAYNALTSMQPSSSGAAHSNNCILIRRIYAPPQQAVSPISDSWDAVVQINACGCPQTFRPKMFLWELHDEHLVKLHNLRQAFEVIFMKDATKMFLIDAGKAILGKLLTPSQKNVCNFEEAYHNLISFIEQPSNYKEMSRTLFSLGVKQVNFYDVVLRLFLVEVLDDVVNIAYMVRSCERKTRIVELQLTVESRGLMYYIGEVVNSFIPDLLLACVKPVCKQRDFLYFLKGHVSGFMRDILLYPNENYVVIDELAKEISENLKSRIGILMSYPVLDK